MDARSGQRGGAAYACVCACAVALTACATEDPGITPPRDRFYFPTALALDPVRPFLYVASSNADLLYNGSTLNVVDLRAIPGDPREVAAAVKAGTISCKAGTTDPSVWECPEDKLVQSDASLRIGHYPSEIRVSSDGARLFLPVRGQNYLLWASIVERGPGVLDLRCNDDPGGCRDAGAGNCAAWDCDDAHRVAWSEDRRRALPSEPFGIYLNELTAVHLSDAGVRRTCRDGALPAVPCDCGAVPRCADGQTRNCCLAASGESHVYVTHLSGGEVSLFAHDGNRVTLRDFKGGFFTGSGDIRGAFSVAAQRPGDPESPVYVSSRVDSNLASFVVADSNRIIDGPRAPIGAIAPGTDARGLAFHPGGERLYVVNRAPASLVALDMTPGEDGAPRQAPLWVAEVCSEPSVLRIAPDWARRAQGIAGAYLAYVVCFAAAEIFVVDLTLGRVVDEIIVGRGPNALVIDEPNRRAFIANFLENTVGVIDLDPARSSYHRMVLRIGNVQDLIRH